MRFTNPSRGEKPQTHIATNVPIPCQKNVILPGILNL